jgi:hypothetical protein
MAGSRRIGLPREEWDFAGCPRGREESCWEYEYGRECPRIVETFREDAAGRRRGFDQDGYWFYEHQVFDSQGEYEDSVVLLVPPGFPTVPYLMTKRPRVRSEAKLSATSSRFLHPPKVRDVEGDAKPSFRPPPDYVAKLYVDWNAPDKELLRDFRLWLSEHRPRKARSRRGKSVARQYMADLKALGAYRLLRVMSAEEALAHTRKFLPHGLYAQVPDWYEAKRRARSVLRNRFRAV